MNARFYCIAISLIFISLLSTAQTADFKANVTSGCMPSVTVTFTDLSTGSPNAWNWDFGNGKTSISQHPSVTYTSPGTYDVKLTITGGITLTKTSYIVIHDVPAINFSSNTLSGCPPLNVPFQNASTAGSGNISSTSWIFGDGAIDNTISPSHPYLIPGPYSVTLSVTNQYNCVNSLTKTSYINVKGPLTDFTYSQSSLCVVPATVSFTNQTSGQGNITYSWDFGDNSPASASASPTHQYTTSATYLVSLTATDQSGCSYVKKKNVIISGTSQSGVKFSSPPQVCIGQTVTFTDQSTTFILSRSWDFKDGSPLSIAVSPTNVFKKAGIYNVTLTAVLSSGCQVTTSQNVEVLFDPIPSFKLSPQCNQQITFTNTSQYASTYLWDFEDGSSSTAIDPLHTFTKTGAHKIKLTAYNALKCPVTIESTLNVPGNPSASILPSDANSCTKPSLSGCAPFTIQFKNNSSSDLPLKPVLWNFGDNSTSNSDSPQHIYTNKGNYKVLLVIANNIGCRDTARVEVNVANVVPHADFSVDKTVVCEGEVTSFTDLSTNANFWCWDFGDGFASNDQNATHKFIKPGTYTVTLTAKNAGCSNTITKQSLITVKNPDLTLYGSKTCAQPYDINLINESQNFDRITWDFGDGQSSNSTATNLTHHYDKTGPYTIRLTITNWAEGCTVYEDLPVNIQDVKADFSSADNPVCKNNPILFTDQSQFAVKWDWNFNEIQNDTAHIRNPTKTFSTAGTYNVQLTVTDTDNCTNTTTVPIKVADMTAAFSFTGVSDCQKLKIDFTDNSTGSPPIQKWIWDFGDGNTSQTQNTTNTYYDLKSYTIKLTLQNSEAICSLSSVDAVVFTNPVPDFSTARTTVCLNEAVTFFNQTTNAQTFTWDFGDGHSSNYPVPAEPFGATGSFPIYLSATDQYGCEKHITKQDYITVTHPTAQFEAFQTSAECPPLITTFSDRSIGAANWSWDFGDGQSSILSDATNAYLIPGTYDVSLQVTDNAGCTDQIKSEQLVFVGGPYGKFALSTSPICVNQPIQFDATTTNTALYIWDFGDGNVSDTDQSSIKHTFTSPSDFKTTLTLQDSKGCKVVAAGANTVVSVKANPKIDFHINSNYAFEDEPIKFMPDTAAYQLSWMFDDETDTGTSDIEKSFSHFGIHHATLNALNNDGCAAAVEKDLFIQKDLAMIPNVFTPNDDNQNPTFEIMDIEKGSWSLSIYNRWGTKVYHNDQYDNTWNGYGVSSGVYYYLLINQYRPDRKYKGYAQIMR